MLPSKALLLLLIAATAIILTDTAEAQAATPRQRSSAFNFPASVGPFRRTNVTNHTPDGTNRSAHYSSAYGLLTAYVYPARPPYSPSLPAHFEECRREVRQLWGRTRSISKRTNTLVREGNVYRGMEETFSANNPRAGGDVVSSLLLYKAGDRYVKLRLTSPKSVSDKAAAQLMSFTAKFPWPAASPARSTRL